MYKNHTRIITISSREISPETCSVRDGVVPRVLLIYGAKSHRKAPAATDAAGVFADHPLNRYYTLQQKRIVYCRDHFLLYFEHDPTALVLQTWQLKVLFFKKWFLTVFNDNVTRRHVKNIVVLNEFR